MPTNKKKQQGDAVGLDGSEEQEEREREREGNGC